MGPLALPTSGVVYVDANVIIYSVDRHERYAPALDPLWEASADGRLQVITSELSVMEAMVAPLAKNDPKAISDFEQFFASAFTAQLPIDRSVLIRAALQRATRRSVRTPDAIHIAPAVTAGAEHLITNDRDLAKHSPVRAIVVDDLVPAPPGNP